MQVLCLTKDLYRKQMKNSQSSIRRKKMSDKNLNKHVPKDDLQRTNKHTQRGSTSLITGKHNDITTCQLEWLKLKNDHTRHGKVWRNENASEIQLVQT